VIEVIQLVSRLEAAGGKLTFDGERVRYSIPNGDAEARGLLAELRERKPEVTELLRVRAATPPGARIIGWNLKEPPVAIDTCSVVTDPALFARSTLEQLGVALAHPQRWTGWSVRQLIDRLGQVGVTVTLESEEKLAEADQYKRNETKVTDPYQELVRATLAKVSDQPFGMVPWLKENLPMLYEELTTQLPDEIHRLWEGRAPLVEFKRILDLWLEAHRASCEVYRGAGTYRREGRNSQKCCGSMSGKDRRSTPI
jgi:hypothetical protein